MRRVRNLGLINRSGARARSARRFARDANGATAVEFALVAGPFFFIMMGIVETMLIFFGNLAIEDAVQQVGREIKTGQIQSSDTSMTPEAFKTEVCSKLGGLLNNCSDNLVVAVQAYTQFSGAVCAQAPDPDDANPVMPFDTGSPGSTVVACAFYKWQITTPMMGHLLGNLSGNRRWLQSTILFKNEPFSTS